MNQRKDTAPSSHGEYHPALDAFIEPQELLHTFLNSSAVGFALFDAQLRYQSVNDKLAAMHGIPREAHIGRSVYDILGEAGSQVEPVLRRVFATGRSILDQEWTAQLPARAEVGHWVGTSIPIKSAAGEVRQVGALVVEVTNYKRLEQQIYGLVGRLVRARENLALRGESGLDRWETVDAVAQSVQLLDECLTEARKVYQWLPPTCLFVAAGISGDLDVRSWRGREETPLVSTAMATERPHSAHLTARETEVVQLLARSKSNKEIAAMLNLSVKTVETYRTRIMLKLDLHSIAELVLYAFRHNLVQV